MSIIIYRVKRNSTEGGDEYLYVTEEYELKFDRDIGMADHWNDAKITNSLIEVLRMLDKDKEYFYYIMEKKETKPKFKVGLMKAKLENGLFVDIGGYKIECEKIYYKIHIPCWVEECYLMEP